MTKGGHNTGEEVLLRIIGRVEELQEQRKQIGDDIRVAMSEAKDAGFDVRIVREILRLRKMDPEVRRDVEEAVDLYRDAFGI